MSARLAPTAPRLRHYVAMTKKPWHAEYERMLIEETVRRLGRQRPKDVNTWTVVSQMTRGDRAMVWAITLIPRAVDAVRARLRALRRRLRP